MCVFREFCGGGHLLFFLALSCPNPFEFLPLPCRELPEEEATACLFGFEVVKSITDLYRYPVFAEAATGRDRFLLPVDDVLDRGMKFIRFIGMVLNRLPPGTRKSNSNQARRKVHLIDKHTQKEEEKKKKRRRKVEEK
jgi:hypothetical protein